MNTRLHTLEKRFFRNKSGHIVLWQAPNIPLYGWLVMRILAHIVQSSPWHNGFNGLGTAFLFVWAYSETLQGESYFRRTLGLVVLVLATVGFFQPL